eukprot:Unigene1535_Nuclearia_a/m.4776 Unigene1535_Nuclearia_a/g.4776  ORF Unigene1535_Nuclearia_a/g.4776 Unigene1535_Nuclearia_a/m.4776 type:complete len:319 (-) Unigene1535_Nuclearia_a:1194-2150(-)
MNGRSRRERGDVVECVQRGRVGQRPRRHDRFAADDFLDRDLNFLAVDRVRYLDDREHEGGHMPRRQLGADVLFDALHQRVVERAPGRHLHKQDHALVRALLLPDHERVLDLGVRLEQIVDFGRADADAARVERAVAAPEHDDAARVRVDVEEVAVVPHARELRKVRLGVLGPVGVVPEEDRHARERLGADEVALNALDRLALERPRFDAHAQVAALDLAAIHGQVAVGPGKERHDVRAAGDRAEQHVALDVAVDEVKALGAERRAGRVDRVQRAQVAHFARPHAHLEQRREVLGARAEGGDLELVHQLPQPQRVRLEG